MADDPGPRAPAPRDDDLRLTDPLGPPSPALPDVGHLPAEAQVEAILTDQQRRWQFGSPVPARAYLDAYSVLAQDRLAGAALLFQEYLHRRDGRSPDLFPYYLRDFPEFADGLRQLHQADQDADAVLAPAPAEAPAPPRRFGDYELLQEVGRGGMGVVYKARQVSLGRVVALKLIRDPDAASPAALERFRGEARAAARLRHPNIVAVYEVGEEAGQQYLAMEYVEGGSLAERIRENPLPAPEAARCVEALARAVQHAHSAGVVHRDLKPANVLLPFRREPSASAGCAPPSAPRLDEAEPKITDFGLARVAARERSLTATGEVIGTPGYMSPEQARGDRGTVGPLSDVYGLGAVLYELLTRRPPFSAATAVETLLQVIADEPVPPRALNAGIPRDLETICLKCLQKEPAARYAGAEALADDLGRFLRGEPVRARPVGRFARGWRWCRRNKAVAALAAGLFLSLVGGLVSVAWQLWRVERHRAAAERERDRAQANLAKAQDAVDFIGRRIGAIRLHNVPQVQEVQREVLEYALKFHEGFLEEDSDDPAVRWEAVQACIRVGRIQAKLGSIAKSETAYRRAIHLVEELPADYPGVVERHQALIGCYGGLLMLFLQAKLDSNSEDIVRAMERLFASYPEEHRGSADYRRQRASFLCNKAMLMSPQNGVDLCRQTLDLVRPLIREYPDHLGDKEMLAHACGLSLQRGFSE